MYPQVLMRDWKAEKFKFTPFLHKCTGLPGSECHTKWDTSEQNRYCPGLRRAAILAPFRRQAGSPREEGLEGERPSS